VQDVMIVEWAKITQSERFARIIRVPDCTMQLFEDNKEEAQK
jgi:hypothetical protein